MFGSRTQFYLALALLGGVLDPSRTHADERVIIGRVENVVMQDAGVKLKARIDTGAGVSSIDARNVRVEKAPDGSERVKFDLTDERGKAKTVERKVMEWAEIKSEGGKATVRRPVVTLDICLGGRRLEGRFNLTDRSRFLYPVLVGRNILKTGDFLIDPKGKFLKQPGC
jgi:hypothetical protein